MFKPFMSDDDSNNENEDMETNDGDVFCQNFIFRFQSTEC